MRLADRLAGDDPVLAVELRPPRAGLGSAEGMDAWIDAWHEVRRLTRRGVQIFLTDSAVGTQEENNLRHLVTNLGRELPTPLVAPFLTTKHSLDFCLTYAEQAWQVGFPSLVVLGGDRTVGRPRCVEHAWDLRRLIQAREPRLSLGGWANPHAPAGQQTDFLLDERFCADFYLTQVVSHLDMAPVERFLDATARRDVTRPGMFGVFFYRSANPRTLDTLGQFMPVPIEGLRRELAAGATPVDICARTIGTLRAAGVRHVCLCNIPMRKAAATVSAILDRVGSQAGLE